MKKLVKWAKGKKWEVKIVDTFTGEYLIIDNDFISKKPLDLESYSDITKVKEILNSEKPLEVYSIQ